MKLFLKVIFLTILFFSFSAEGKSQDDDKDKFEKGASYFSTGSYQQALDTWLEIYNTGHRSASLNYNIGNAYFKLNNIPNSILFYERAYMLDPADEDTNYNLAIARTLIVDRFQEIPELFFIRWYDFISLMLTTNQWAKISLVLFILSLILISLYIYSSRYSYKVLGFWLAMIFFIFSLSSFAFARRNNLLVHESNQAIITSPVVSGKSSPDSSGTDLFVLHEGTKVDIEDEVGEWYEIRLSDGNKGWIPVNSLNII